MSGPNVLLCILSSLVIAEEEIIDQGHSQNAEIVTHIKGRLLERAVILSIASLFRIGTSLEGKNLLPEGANSFL